MVGDPGVIVTVGDEEADDPPPRVARNTPAARATVPPMMAALTQVGDHQPTRFTVGRLRSSTILLTFDMGTVISPTWFP